MADDLGLSRYGFRGWLIFSLLKSTSSMPLARVFSFARSPASRASRLNPKLFKKEAARSHLRFLRFCSARVRRVCGKTLVVTASPEIQRERVLARPEMSEAKFAALMARQMPDADKRERADYVIDTGNGMEAARLAVTAIIMRHAAG